MLNSLAIRVKIPLGFAIVLVIVVILGLLSINRLGTVNDNAEQIRDNWLPSTGQMSKLLTSIYSFRLRESRYLLVAGRRRVDADPAHHRSDEAVGEP